MTDIDRTSWFLDGPATSSFAHPRGLRGRLAGWVMHRSNGRASREVAARVPAGGRVLEVGFGPGVLLRALAARPDAPRLVGVEPSPVMLGRARRLLPDAELHAGTAAATGLPTASVDHVVSVNTVAIWPDLDAGLDELRRVLRDGGTLLLAWHRGAGARSPASRRIGLPAAALARIEDGLRARFPDVTRDELSDVLLWTAVS